MFVIGKLLTIVLLPSALMVELTLLGLLARRWRLGRAMLVVGVGALGACLVLPVDFWAIRPLEDRFPQVTTPPDRVDGIVVLGGALDELTSVDRGTPTFTSAANRITSFLLLAKRYPQARLLFTGGSGAIEQGLASEADYARTLLDQLGLPPERVTFETTSRTTWENAVNSAALVRPQPAERWVLVTSASHMPRAVGVFRRAGWTVLPWPVGYQSRDRIATWTLLLGAKLATLDWAVHEWLGLVIYRIEGKTDVLFPAPEPAQ